MRTFGGTVFATAAQAEGLTTAQAQAAIRQFDPPTVNGMVAWLNDPANQGADETAWRAAWPNLASLDDPHIRFVMRVMAELGGGWSL